MAKEKADCIIITNAGLLVQAEGKAGEAGIYPGHIVEESAFETYLRNNAAATVDSVPLVAIEDRLTGKTADAVYGLGDRVYTRALTPGTKFQGRVAPAAAAIVFGDNLTWDGDGGFKKAIAGNVVKAKALAAVDNSAGASSVLITLRAV